MEIRNLEPREVFFYFEEIAKIPHGSGNTQAISNYLVSFAKERKLEHYQDELGNVIIIKEASKGYEDREPVMLQGHMDMVAVKKPDSKIDMKTEGLTLMTEGDWLFAKDTSLGGDDGIAVAYELALLAAEDLEHPRLECVFTVDEEIGLLGAKAIDVSMCKAKRMINIDSEDEGIFLTGCAGGMRVDCHLPLEKEEKKGILVTLKIGGLQGGHSGVEIHKERGNSNVLMGRFLAGAAKNTSLYLSKLQGGLADNAIPRETRAEFLVEETGTVEDLVKRLEKELKCELATKDPGVYCQLEIQGEQILPVVTKEETKKAAALLYCLPQGVQAMSADVKGLVETSLNMGLLSLKEDGLHAGFSVRSSLESAKYALEEKLYVLTESLGGSCKTTGDYPGWAYRVDSPLRELMLRIFKEKYGKEPVVEAIHAGLECGFFLDKIPQLDCVSMGPDMKDIHTTEEKMSISSVKRVWEYLVEVLKQA